MRRGTEDALRILILALIAAGLSFVAAEIVRVALVAFWGAR